MLTTEQTIQTLEIIKEEEIAAPIGIVFETLLEQIGPLNEKPDGEPLPMKLEAWPGGRWYRDLGNNTGHFWGNVQAIKPPALLEICGPLFMSFPVASNVQYRLKEEKGVTVLRMVHRAVGLIPAEMLDGAAVGTGWAHILRRIREKAMSSKKGGK